MVFPTCHDIFLIVNACSVIARLVFQCLCFKLAELGTLSELRWQCDGCCVRPVSGLKTGGRKQSPFMNSRSKVSMVKTFLWTSTGKQAVDSHHMTVDNDDDSATCHTQLVFNWPFLPCLPGPSKISIGKAVVMAESSFCRGLMPSTGSKRWRQSLVIDMLCVHLWFTCNAVLVCFD